MSAVQRLEQDDVDDPADDATIPEAVEDQRTSKELNLRMLRIEDLLVRRQRALEKAAIAVEEQKQEIAAQQAKLVELEAVEIEKSEAIENLNDEKRTLAHRIATLSQAEGQSSSSALPQQDPVQMADECLTRKLLGLQNFVQQSPQIKERLLLFAREIEKLQAAEREAPLPSGQLTLDHSFAAQRSAQTVVQPENNLDGFPNLAAAVQKKREGERAANASPTADTLPCLAGPGPGPASPAPVELYNIHSGVGTPSDVSQLAVPTIAATSYGRAPRKHEPLCKTCWAVVCKCGGTSGGHACAPSGNAVHEGTMEVDTTVAAPETAMVVWQPPGDRMQLLAQLKAKNLQQQERSRKQAQEASSQRHSPY